MKKVVKSICYVLIIPALCILGLLLYPLFCDHSFERVDEDKATCEEAGTAYYECRLCGKEKEEPVEPLEHRMCYSDSEMKEVGASVYTRAIYVCDRCGYEDVGEFEYYAPIPESSEPIEETEDDVPEATTIPTTDDEKTAEQMYLEWEVYNLLTTSIQDSSLRVNLQQIYCSNRSDDGRYLVYGVYYIGSDLHTIMVYYETNGDSTTFNKEDFHISEVIMDQEKVYPDENS